MNLLITGGAGFIGQELVRQALPIYKKIIVFSRSESAQAKMKQDFPEGGESGMRYMIGDIRDEARLAQAMRNVDHVIHAAALKRVEVCEYDTEEAIKTNVLGSLSVIHACNTAHVSKCLMISTDKAVEPCTAYGNTKAMMERAAIGANNHGDCRFACARYANVRGSTGSVLELWKTQISTGEPVTITDRRMSRMWIDKDQAAKFVIGCLWAMEGGEIFVPKCEKVKVIEMLSGLIQTTIGEGTPPEIREIGLRPNEKLHEILISEADARHCYDTGDHYVIYPATHDWRGHWVYNGALVEENFRLSSNEEE